MSLHPTTWVEIDLSAIRHNIRALRSRIAPLARIMAVVKADAYGHGAIEVSKTALDSGATHLAVARIEEAIRLRNASITAPILVLEPLGAHALPAHIQYHLTATVSDVAGVQTLLAASSPIQAHIKIDTGMGRIGLPFNSNGTIALIQELHKASHVHLEGIYSHFARADEANLSFTQQQLQEFLKLLDTLQAKEITFDIRHIANSAAAIRVPESHLNMVRLGISMYGHAPSGDVDVSFLHLQPAMTVKSHISHVKNVPAGFPVSYNSIYTTNEPTTLITIPIGYADGFHRSLSNQGHILYQGERYPIVGRVCMDQLMVDVKNTPVQIGDEVTIMGKDNYAQISAEEIATQIGTISYEVLCNFVARAPRIYTPSEPANETGP